ncbi:lipoprotein [Spiroplasma endosymbiont of Diplazon laetatorius]|uniref:lipoprotein n=1 Tax=Spiroplasma endosymbiont of Diplazon laetatorius TaxID=3066322 RepID=UPI0030D218A5
MKKLLSILAAVSFVVSTTSTTVVSCAVKTSGINSLNYKWNLGQMTEVNQKEIIKKIAEVNGINSSNIENRQKDIENLASMRFDHTSITKLTSSEIDADSGDTYVATIRTSEYSRVLKGRTQVTFKATPEVIEKAKNPIAQKESNLSGTWWNWGNTLDVNGKNITLEGKDAKLEKLVSNNNPYDIINISSTFTKAGKYAIDSIAMNDFTLTPELNDPSFDNQNSKFLIDRKNKKVNSDDVKFITSFGGATADRMLWNWKQKDELKDKLKSILDGFGLDGIDLAVAGETLYNRESQETLCQAVKEIMVERWLSGKDFYLSISARLIWMFKDALDRNKATVIPLIDSLEGWYDDITLLMYNITRPKNFAIAQEDFEIDGQKFKKGDKIGTKYNPQIENASYFYGTLRAIIDPSWSKNSKFIDLSNKPIRISVANEYSTTSSAFGFKSGDLSVENKSNWEIALEQFKKDSPEAFKNIKGFNYFGVNIDQILSNEKPSEPKQFLYGSNLSRVINENLKTNQE